MVTPVSFTVEYVGRPIDKVGVVEVYSQDNCKAFSLTENKAGGVHLAVGPAIGPWRPCGLAKPAANPYKAAYLNCSGRRLNGGAARQRQAEAPFSRVSAP